MNKIIIILISFFLFSQNLLGQGNTLPSSGNVGIRNTNPLSPLHVNSIRPILFNYNGGSGVYGSEIGFNSILKTTVVPNKFFKLGGTNQRGGANLAVDYYGNMRIQTFTHTSEDSISVDYKPQFTFANNGNFGIGITNPTHKLEVNGSSLIKGSQYLTGNYDGNVRLVFTPTGIGNNWEFYPTTDGIGLYDRTNSVYRQFMTNTGNLGIGTTSPNEKFVVRGNSARIRIETESSPTGYFSYFESNYNSQNPFNIVSGVSHLFGNKYFGIQSADTYMNSYYGLAFTTATTNPATDKIRMYIAQNGQVGVGTTSPQAKFHSTGNVELMSGHNIGQMALGDLSSAFFQVAGSQRGTDTTNQFQGGFGFLSGSSQISPVVWMYGHTPRNAFQVRKKGYNQKVQDGGLLLHVGANNKIGVLTDTPSSTMHFGANQNQGIQINSATSNAAFYTAWQDFALISVNRNGYNGLFTDPNKGDGMIGIQSLNNGSKIIFRTSNAPNILSSEKVVIDQEGRMGIGTTNPTAKLTVDGVINSYDDIQSQGAIKTKNYLLLDNDGDFTGGNYFTIQDDTNNNLRIGYGFDENLIIKPNGSLGIGTSVIPTGYKLAVQGKVIAEKVVIRKSGNWPDFVFDKKYKLPTIEEVASFIENSGHLPEIPSAKEIEDNGQDLGEMNRLLLQKVEELTLYTIQQQKEIKRLRSLEKRIELLESKL